MLTTDESNDATIGQATGNEGDADSAVPRDPDARDLYDQEKAQQIAHEDLSRENKQVCNTTICVDSHWSASRD